jgi:hypothetical protein
VPHKESQPTPPTQQLSGSALRLQMDLSDLLSIDDRTAVNTITSPKHLCEVRNLQNSHREFRISDAHKSGCVNINYDGHRSLFCKKPFEACFV